ncbi:MAG TPA: hypothetical protein VEW74_04325, partial [Candidatus Nitrosotalea sp.]|nr:hypothetical protein [Candidatus Nitrosotalea sp.]
DAIDYDGVVAENAEEQFGVLGVEAVNVFVDQTHYFSRWRVAHVSWALGQSIYGAGTTRFA